MARRVYVIGSGLSAEFGLPLASDLTEIMLEEVEDRLYSFFQGHLQILFPRYLRGQTSAPPLFEFISLIKSSSDLSAYLWPEKFTEATNWRAFLLVIKRALTYHFRKKVESIKPSGSLDSLTNFCENLIPGDIIISFNWDCLFEIVFNRLGLQWTTQLPTLNNGWDYQWPMDKIYILKLHGSIDWMRQIFNVNDCPPRWTIAVSNTSNLYRISDYENEDIGALIEGDDPTIHLPGEEEPSKEYREIWKTALKLLLKASEITFIGYSLPFYDLYERNLFLVSTGRARAEGNDQKIKIVNPDLGLKLTYESVFGEAIKYYDLKFSHWIESVKARLYPME